MLTLLHTPCHSSCCTSFSALRSCFPMFFSLCFNFQSCSFLVTFWKRSFLGPPICFRFWDFVVDTLFRHSTLEMQCICFFLADYVLVLYFAFVIAVIKNTDSLQLIKLFLNQMGKAGARVSVFQSNEYSGLLGSVYWDVNNSPVCFNICCYKIYSECTNLNPSMNLFHQCWIEKNGRIKEVNE